MKKYAPLFIIIAGCLWGTMGLFVRHLNTMGLGSMEIVELRCIIAAVMLFPVILIRGNAKLKPKNLIPLVSSGLFSIVFFNFCYFSTISLMDLSVAAILLYTAPIFVMLLSLVLFRERLTARKVAALVLAFLGCCLVSGIGSGNSGMSLKGLLLGLGAGLGYALYSIFSRYSINQGLSSMTITVYTFLFAAIGGGFLTDFSLILSALENHGIVFLGFAVLYTLVTTVLPYLLYTTGLSYVENGAASVMASVEPVVATLLGVIVFHEKPTVSALVGMLLVLIALGVLNLKKKNIKSC